jgi:hypothetical protein
VKFLATAFALGAGSFVCPSIHEVLGPPLSYPTPLKHPGRGASHSGLFVRGCSVVLYEDSCISTRGHSFVRIGNTAPSISDVIPMGTKRFALHRVRVSLAQFVFRRLLRQSDCGNRPCADSLGARVGLSIWWRGPKRPVVVDVLTSVLVLADICSPSGQASAVLLPMTTRFSSVRLHCLWDQGGAIVLRSSFAEWHTQEACLTSASTPRVKPWY